MDVVGRRGRERRPFRAPATLAEHGNGLLDPALGIQQELGLRDDLFAAGFGLLGLAELLGLVLTVFHLWEGDLLRYGLSLLWVLASAMLLPGIWMLGNLYREAGHG